jgi:DNA-binding MarR family transcriptional regulator
MIAKKRAVVSAPALQQQPLATLLSQVLVAFTIEFDNEYEHRAPHRTSVGGVAAAGAGPWLVSMAMYSNLMRLVPDAGVTVRELVRLARTRMIQLRAMGSWGYITVTPDPADKRAKPPQRDWLVRPTARGARAREIWQPIFGEIEKRWRERFGDAAMSGLRQALAAVESRFDRELPEYLPVLGFGMTAEVLDEPRAPKTRRPAAATELTLPALLAKVLLAFTLEFERESEVSLPICANVLRLLGDDAVPLRDLPARAGVSKEAIHMAITPLKARGFVLIEPDRESGRGRAIRLTAKGRGAREKYLELLGEIEGRWKARFGGELVDALHNALMELAGDSGRGERLLAGLTTYPEGWRAAIRTPQTLPHSPMVLHRGGYPDGS